MDLKKYKKTQTPTAKLGMQVDEPEAFSVCVKSLDIICFAD